MKNNYKSGSLSEASENGGSSTSYTINKNDLLYKYNIKQEFLYK